MKKILQIGPVPSKKNQLLGGMQAYMEGLLSTDLPKHYLILLLNTSIPPIYKKMRILRPVLTLSFLAKLIFLLLFKRPDIAHIHMSEGIRGSGIAEKRMFATLCRRFNVRVILHLHGATFDDFYKNNTGHFSRILNENDRNIVLSQAWKHLFSSTVEVSKLSVVPNAIHFIEYDYPPRTAETLPVRILFVGAVGERKGLPDLGKALSLIDRKLLKRIHLDIVGPEEFNGEFERITTMFKEFGLSESCTFRGPVFGHAKIEFYKRADIFVLPSRNESFGIVNLEAMASSLPILSTSIGAIPEYIEPGVNGFLFHPEDVEQLAKHIETLVENPEMRQEMGTKNREKVRNEYDWSSVSKHIAEIYDEL